MLFPTFCDCLIASFRSGSYRERRSRKWNQNAVFTSWIILLRLRLQITTLRGGWGGGGRRSPKKFFSALRASVWSKNRGGGGPPEPLPYIRHCCVRDDQSLTKWHDGDSIFFCVQFRLGHNASRLFWTTKSRERPRVGFNFWGGK